FTGANAYHNVSLAPAYLSGGTVRLRYVDEALQDTIGSALSLDLVAVVILNDQPVLTNDGVSPASGDITTNFTFYVRYFDPDNDTIAWSLIRNAPWLSMGPVNGTVWGVAPSGVSSFYVDVIAGDGFGGSASDNFTLSVTDVGPTITNSIAIDGVHTSRPYV